MVVSGILRSKKSGKTRNAFIGRWRGEEVEVPSGLECGDAGSCGEKPEDVGESLPAWHVIQLGGCTAVPRRDPYPETGLLSNDAYILQSDSNLCINGIVSYNRD